MSVLMTVAVLLAMAFMYMQGTRRAVQASVGRARALHSRPHYHGWYTALWTGIPALLVLILYATLGNRLLDALVLQDLSGHIRSIPIEQHDVLIRDARTMAFGGQISEMGFDSHLMSDMADRYRHWQQLGLAAVAAIVAGLASLGGTYAMDGVSAEFRARNRVERVIKIALIAASGVAVLTTLGIVLSLVFEAARFFKSVPITEFLFGTHWSPQIAIRADQVGQSGAFGAVPLFAGTLLIMAIAMVVAIPIGLFSAIYLTEYAPRRVRDIVKPLLEILAGIPTVVYGFFAALTVGPAVRAAGEALGFSIPNQSALAAGMVMGVMIIPFISSLSDDVINAVPQSLRDGSYAMGATSSETVRQVILPAALPGIVGAVLLAISRAIGETMIVTMAAGQAANLTANPFQQVTTVTVQIVMLLTGDQEFDSPKTLAAFGLGLTLFLVTLMLNVVALKVVQKYRERYD
jgi:phosphate transport system permease protein